VINLPPSDSTLARQRLNPTRQCLNPTILVCIADDLLQFWDSLWNKDVDLIHMVNVVRDSDLVEGLTIPPTIRVLFGLPKILASGDVFIRK